VTRSLRRRLENDESEFVIVPCVNPVAIEAHMAGAGQRRTKFHPRENPNHFPEPVCRVAPAPEGGIEDGEARQASYGQAIDRKFGLYEKKLRSDFGPTGNATAPSPENEKARIRNMIKLKSETNVHVFYILEPMPREEKERENTKAFLTNLRRNYAPLAVLAYEQDEQQELNDELIFGSLVEILPIRSQAK
jgi:hypothetical protein